MYDDYWQKVICAGCEAAVLSKSGGIFTGQHDMTLQTRCFRVAAWREVLLNTAVHCGF